MPLTLGLRDPSKFKYDSDHKHVLTNWVSTTTRTLLDSNGECLRQGEFPYSLLAGVPYTQNPVILNIPVASNGESLAPVQAAAEMLGSKARNTVATRTDNVK
jgi:hypothetical protein